MSWGEPGTDPGQFNIAHNICCDPDGWVYVADRENHRVQVFDGNGKYETQWNNMHRPSGLCMESGTRTPRFFVGEIGPDMAVNIDLPELRSAGQHLYPEGRTAGAARPCACRARPRPVHLAARPRRRFARRHLCRRGVVSPIGVGAFEPAASDAAGLRSLQKLVKVA